MARTIQVNEFAHRAVVDADPSTIIDCHGGGRFLDDGEPEIEVGDDAGRAANEELLDVDQAIELAFASRAVTKPIEANVLSHGLRSVVIIRDGEPRWRRGDVLRFLAASDLL